MIDLIQKKSLILEMMGKQGNALRYSYKIIEKEKLSKQISFSYRFAPSSNVWKFCIREYNDRSLFLEGEADLFKEYPFYKIRIFNYFLL